MDFKTIFRYQLSGTVFIVWLLVFNLSITSANFQDIFTKISSFELSNLFTAVAAGIPIGTIIHQISIFIKNCIFGKLFGLPYFIDSMKDDARLTDCIARRYNDLDASIVNDKITSTHKKMSYLNTFYYLRFDNGLIAPLFAYIIFIMNESLKNNSLMYGGVFSACLITFSLLLVPLLMLLWQYIEECISIKKSSYKILSIIIGMVLGLGLGLGLNYNFFTNQNKSYISTEYYTTINNTTESIVSSYVTTNQIRSISSKSKNDIIDSLILPINISKITTTKTDKTAVVQTPVDNRLQVIAEISALIYMLLMLMYIPVLYNQRKECWEYYFGIFNKYFVGEDVSINTHLFNEYQNGRSKSYITISIQKQDSNKKTNDPEKVSQKYSIDEFDVDSISHELVKQVAVNQYVTETKIKEILNVIQTQFKIFIKQQRSS